MRVCRTLRRRLHSQALAVGLLVGTVCGVGQSAEAQSFGVSNLDFAGQGSVSLSTSLEFGPDGRLYVMQLDGTLVILTIQRNGPDDYVVVSAEEVLAIKSIPNHNDDGSDDGGTSREATGITVEGSATNPIVYATSSDARIGGPSGDTDLDTNSGVITRLTWIGSDIDDPQGYWDAVDLVRGLPRSEENHATNGLEWVLVGSDAYLIVAQGGHVNAGAPSKNFAWHTEYALSAAVLAVNLTQLESLPILNDGSRQYVYDLPTVDDPTRANVNGVADPNDPAYDGVDLNDPWGGNDGLNQAKLVPGGPVQIFSPGYRNAYDLVLTVGGAVYVTDNGANGGWGGLPENEGIDGTVTNNYRPGEPGSSSPDPVDGEPQVNNEDHLHLVTNDIDGYVFGSFYGGHPTPIRANPLGAGLFARGDHSSDIGDSNGNTYEDDWFRTIPYDPSAGGDAADPERALPADWPPVPPAFANPVEGDYRNPGGVNPDGPVDDIISTWGNNTNGIDEYTASNFGGAMQGNLIAGKSGGSLHRVQVAADGSLVLLTQNFITNLGGNPLGITANSDSDPFPGTIWVGTFNANIVVLEPQDFITCLLPGDPGYDALGDNDSDGYTNQDEEDNGSDPCNGGSQPLDYDKQAGAPLVSDLNDLDDDADGIDDASDPLQLGNPTVGGTDAFALPVINELFSDNPELGGYLGLGFTGLMNNGAANPNWLLWLDQTDAGPNPNDILGGAVGAMTMQMGPGTALGPNNDQEKGFQYGVQVDLGTGGFRVEGRLLNFTDPLQLYGSLGAGELGIFMGDGTQSDFVQIVLGVSGARVVEEVADTVQEQATAEIPLADRPTGSATLRLDVDSASGAVAASFAVDGGAFVPIGTVTLEGSLLDAVQQSGSLLTVGLIGTSETPGAELEGTWDYLNVVGRQPTVPTPIPNVEAPVGSGGSQNIDLTTYFDDDDGDGNLTFTVESETNPLIGAVIVGSVLTLTYPDETSTSTIVVRATDQTGLFVEQSFTVSVTAPVAIYRVNAGGAEIAAIDGGIPWGADTGGANSPYLSDPGSNDTAGFSIPDYAPGVDLATTPTAIFATERWDNGSGLPRITYSFPVSDGSYQVRLYMANGWGGAATPGGRIFSVQIEGTAYPDLTNLDLTATFGHQVGGIVTEVVDVVDGAVDIEFFHGPADNPMLNGIEIIGGGGAPPVNPPLSVAAIPNQQSVEGQIVALPVIASGGDTPNIYAYSALGLPPGVAIEPTTGLIFGTIAPGAFLGSPYQVLVTVDDTDTDPTDTATEGFTWTISDPNNLVWIDLDEDENYTGRHECSFVQAGDKFYLFGGRENPETLDTYDFASDTWTISAQAPKPFNHFQATEYEGLVWVIGAFENNNFPNEEPADDVWVFDPANGTWTQGPSIPEARRRGGTGLVVHDGKFYMVAGNTIGHAGGYVPWFDEFDPVTGTFTELADAPRSRDHFHAVVQGDKLYVIGGRLSGGPGGTFAPLISEVDVYDFATATWSTLTVESDLPTPRAASATAVFDGRIFVMGGEGNGQAYTTVEAFAPPTGSWETMPSMNFPRHGTQAIVSGGGMYITAGSPQQGGGNQKNMEVFGADAPSGIANTPGELTLSISQPLNASGPFSLYLDHTGGNQGVYVSDVAISGADQADFSIVSTVPTAFLVRADQRVEVQLNYSGSGEPDASVDVTMASGPVASLSFGSPPPPPPPDCTSQADCDNGSFCDGVETCVAGSCLSGSPVVCDDGIACTVDSCNETADACSQTPSNALCSNGLFCDGVEACSPIVGCEAGIAPCSGSDLCNETIDACVPDGGGGPVRYRSNAGGPTLPATDGGIDWIGGSPADAGLATVANVSSTGETVAWSSSEPPAALFQTEVWDNAGGDEMRWEFSVPPGNYEVRIYFAEIYGGTFGNGLRVFDVLVEGAVVLDDYDIFSLYGALAGAVEVVSTSVTDGSLTIEFIHGVENPKVAGFEIIDLATSDPDADGDGVTVGEGDCNDADPNVRPGVSDPCDGVDNDCDGAFDEDYVSLPTQCGVGACEASGATVCDALSSTEIDTCTPGTPAPDDSSCDGVDSDCDGVVDEDCVVVPSIKAETGVALANDTSWTTVNLSNDYGTGMVVVSTPVHVPGSPPYVARVRNASGSAFEMQLAIAGPTGSPVSSEVHYFVVEEGVYDEATFGVQLEAVKYLSTVTDSRSGWVGETRTYAQTYGSPVVVGQVMSANDPEESVFWARGSSRTNPPNATNLVTGKAVNEDPNITRANETVGYVVVEAGSGAIAGLNFQALLGSDTIRGVSNAPPYSYALGALSGASVAVTSLAGLDGNNGGWAMLYGPLDSTGTTVDLVVEEDALRDSERSHTTEQLSVIVFE